MLYKEFKDGNYYTKKKILGVQVIFWASLRNTFDLFTAFYSLALVGFYCSSVERRSEEASEAVQSQTNEQLFSRFSRGAE